METEPKSFFFEPFPYIQKLNKYQFVEIDKNRLSLRNWEHKIIICSNMYIVYNLDKVKRIAHSLKVLSFELLIKNNPFISLTNYFKIPKMNNKFIIHQCAHAINLKKLWALEWSMKHWVSRDFYTNPGKLHITLPPKNVGCLWLCTRLLGSNYRTHYITVSLNIELAGSNNLPVPL